MKKKVIEKFTTLITAAFGLIAALAWNSAVQELFKKLFPVKGTLIAMFSYAVFVTIIAVLITLWLVKSEEK